MGDYDATPRVAPTLDGVDFYIFSDIDLGGRTTWKNMVFSVPTFSPAAQNRFVKMHPLLMLSQYEYCVYVDGNVEVVGDIRKFVDDALRDDAFVVGMYDHPYRNCIYSEGAACILHSRDWFWRISKQLRRYYKDGYPLSNGLYEAGVMLIKNSPTSADFFGFWWAEYLAGSMRDQISLPYTAWKLGISITSLGKSDFRYTHKYFRLDGHKSKRKSVLASLSRVINWIVYFLIPMRFVFGIPGWSPTIGEPGRKASFRK